MTEQLYYQDSHLAEFTAVVQSCERSGACYKVVLDRTAFFPEGGGQSADPGFLNEVKVIDVQETDGEIYHFTEQEIPAGTVVNGKIDWKERFSRMQQHSGEHIVSGLIYQKYGYNNVGFHLGKEDVTIDVAGVLTKEQMREIEFLANEAVVKDLDIEVLCPPQEELEHIFYRSKIEIEGQVRIIRIEGYDSCACCAPHLKKTGEIGAIKLTGLQNYKGGVRISLLCGFRALADYNEKETSVKNISAALSAKENEVYEGVEQLKAEKAALKNEIAQLQKKLIACKVKDIEPGKASVCLFEEELDGNGPRELVNLILEKGVGICAVFAGNEADGYRYVIGSRKSDTRPVAKALNEKFSGRGGGKPEMVQGSLRGKREEIYDFFICSF